MSDILEWEEFEPLLEGSVPNFGGYFISFVKRFMERDKEDAELAGSGTLVAAGGRKGILTAEHVVGNLPEREFGLVAMTKAHPHQFVVNAQRVQKIRIARGRNDAEGPDLGLIVLPPPNVESLEALGKAFYNLSTRKDRMLATAPRIDLGAWILCGAAHEWTRDVPNERFERVKAFRATCAFGVLEGEREAEGYDYFRYEAKYGEGYEGPESFEGFSGGGLWQLLVERRDGKPRVKELLLSGVAFYQHPIVDGRRVIECHGRRGVYDVAERALARATS